MDNSILTVSDRGQITIPKKAREALPYGRFEWSIVNDSLVLKPLQTRDEFFAELEESEKDWEEHGGVSFEEIKKKYCD